MGKHINITKNRDEACCQLMYFSLRNVNSLRILFYNLILISVCCVRMTNCYAHSYLVNTNSDDTGPGSFYQAILDANNNPGLDEIVFSISDTIIFDTANFSSLNYLPTIEDSLTIIGNKVTFIGLGDKRFFEINKYTYIEDITFEGGYAPLIAGAIKINSTDVFLENCSFLENIAEGITGANVSGWGGALSIFEGDLTLSSCYFELNEGLTRGAAIYSTTMSTVTIIDTEFVENGLNEIHNAIYAGDTSSIILVSATIDPGDFDPGREIVLDGTSCVIFAIGYEFEDESIEIIIE